MIYFIWFFLAMLFLLIEIGSPTLFYFLTISLSSFVAGLVAYFFPEKNLISACSFLFSFCIFLWVFWLYHKRYLLRSKSSSLSNIDALIGVKGFVTVEIMPYRSGQVNIAGQIWSAHSINHTFIKVGVAVQVISIKGVHVIVQCL